MTVEEKISKNISPMVSKAARKKMLGDCGARVQAKGRKNKGFVEDEAMSS